jgi:hypothetical protein
MQSKVSRQAAPTRDVSSPRELSIRRISPGDTRLPAPSIDQAAGDIVDLAQFSGDAVVRIAPWPLIAEGQRVWLRVDAQAADGGTVSQTVIDGVSVTPAMTSEGVSGNLPRAWLESLNDGVTLQVEVHVNFTGGEHHGGVAFPVAGYTLSSVGHWDHFDDASIDPVSAIDRPLFSIVCHDGSPYPTSASIGGGELIVNSGPQTRGNAAAHEGTLSTRIRIPDGHYIATLSLKKQWKVLRVRCRNTSANGENVTIATTYSTSYDIRRSSTDIKILDPPADVNVQIHFTGENSVVFESLYVE